MLKIYGKYIVLAQNGGLMIDNRWGWFWMELPALFIMPVIILTSPVEKNNTILLVTFSMGISLFLQNNYISD